MKVIYLEVRADVSTWIRVQGSSNDLDFELLKKISAASATASDWRGYPYIKYYDVDDEHYAEAAAAYKKQESDRLEDRERVKF